MTALPKYTPAVPSPYQEFQRPIDRVIASLGNRDGAAALLELQDGLRDVPVHWVGARRQYIKQWLHKYAAAVNDGR